MSKRNRDYYYYNKYSSSQIITELVNKIENENFEDKKIKDVFLKEIVETTFKKKWNIFNNVYWRDILKYSLNSPSCKSLKLGQLFKNSPNGIYDFIVSGISFGGIPYNNSPYYGARNSQQGIMLLNVNNIRIYCYYKFNMGGCPTCGMDPYKEPVELYIYVAENIDGIVNYCMSEKDRLSAFVYFDYC